MARTEDEMAHSIAEIEDNALGLPAEDRARLALRLLASLEETVESPEEIEKLWIVEAERRIAAVLALASTTNEGEEPRARIRIAAAGCANEHLRVALEKLADGATDESAIEDAIAVEQKPK